MESNFTLLGLLTFALQDLEDNFTLAVIVFFAGFVAVLVTLIFIVSMHRHWERRSGSSEGEDQ
jgi:heme/copper-type cytochrome/quinol oxidase subunit 4